MTPIKGWAAGIVDEVIGVAKRAAGELGARPDLVLDGEAQQTKGRAELAGDAPAPGDHVAGWKLDRENRADLLAAFPPRHAFTVADHVTLRAKVAAEAAAPPTVRGEIVGRTDDGQGVEAMIVAIDGSTQRPDGGTFHITWSLGPGHRAQESNEVIARIGWKPLPEPVPITLLPAIFD